jgi:hypothetical protein
MEHLDSQRATYTHIHGRTNTEWLSLPKDLDSQRATYTHIHGRTNTEWLSLPKDGASWQEAAERWNILTAKEPHTHTFTDEQTQNDSPCLKMAHLDRKPPKDGTSWQPKSHIYTWNTNISCFPNITAKVYMYISYSHPFVIVYLYFTPLVTSCPVAKLGKKVLSWLLTISLPRWNIYE